MDQKVSKSQLITRKLIESLAVSNQQNKELDRLNSEYYNSLIRIASAVAKINADLRSENGYNEEIENSYPTFMETDLVGMSVEDMSGRIIESFHTVSCNIEGYRQEVQGSNAVDDMALQVLRDFENFKNRKDKRRHATDPVGLSYAGRTATPDILTPPQSSSSTPSVVKPSALAAKEPSKPSGKKTEEKSSTPGVKSPITANPPRTPVSGSGGSLSSGSKK